MTLKEFKEIIEREEGFQVIKEGACHKITNKEGGTYTSTPIKDRQLHYKEVCLNVQEYNYIIERIQTKIQMECDIVYEEGGNKLLSDIYDDVEKLKIKEE